MKVLGTEQNQPRGGFQSGHIATALRFNAQPVETPIHESQAKELKDDVFLHVEG